MQRHLPKVNKGFHLRGPVQQHDPAGTYENTVPRPMPGNRPGGGQTTKSLLIRRKVREFPYRSQHRFILLSTVLAAFVLSEENDLE